MNSAEARRADPEGCTTYSAVQPSASPPSEGGAPFSTYAPPDLGSWKPREKNRKLMVAGGPAARHEKGAVWCGFMQLQKF